MRVASGLVLALSALALGRAIPPNECSHEVQDATQNQDAPLEKRGGCWPWGRNEAKDEPYTAKSSTDQDKELQEQPKDASARLDREYREAVRQFEEWLAGIRHGSGENNSWDQNTRRARRAVESSSRGGRKSESSDDSDSPTRSEAAPLEKRGGCFGCRGKKEKDEPYAVKSSTDQDQELLEQPEDPSDRSRLDRELKEAYKEFDDIFASLSYSPGEDKNGKSKPLKGILKGGNSSGASSGRKHVHFESPDPMEQPPSQPSGPVNGERRGRLGGVSSESMVRRFVSPPRSNQGKDQQKDSNSKPLKSILKNGNPKPLKSILKNGNSPGGSSGRKTVGFGSPAPMRQPPSQPSGPVNGGRRGRLGGVSSEGMVRRPVSVPHPKSKPVSSPKSNPGPEPHRNGRPKPLKSILKDGNRSEGSSAGKRVHWGTPLTKAQRVKRPGPPREPWHYAV
ncbi:hypothetical protein PLICBS_004286 [Purpureocillium lilacinum]|uniref:uncharacterized protein n=1 Tax=Purpureocillium lilacinum TaxID=33203 RepID=UPI00208D879E|nr:hypothetical protein PLICBS_004286 [Purpureocillium lilacinum]